MVEARTNRVMLVDFGVARYIPPTQKGVTPIGSLGYAPPELFAGNADQRSDIYSLGATMFHLLTGKDPQDNPLLIFDFTKNPKPRQINPSITPDMEEMICKAVEHKPENRFASGAAFGEELETHLRDLQEQGRPKRYCPSCQYPAKPDRLFCTRCGSRLEIAEGTSRAGSEQLLAKIDVARLTRTQSLDLSNHQLTELPQEIAQLSNLQSLDLSNNQLTALPAWIGQLSNLQSLDLSNNQLTALPAEIGQLSNLRSLNLEKNPLKKGGEEVKKYLPAHTQIKSSSEAEPDIIAEILPRL